MIDLGPVGPLGPADATPRTEMNPEHARMRCTTCDHFGWAHNRTACLTDDCACTLFIPNPKGRPPTTGRGVELRAQQARERMDRARAEAYTMHGLPREAAPDTSWMEFDKVGCWNTRARARQSVSPERFAREFASALASMWRAVAPWLFWVGVGWGFLAALASVGLVVTGDFAAGGLQFAVAMSCLLGLPLGRAYRRRKAYHRELRQRADQWWADPVD